MLNPSNPLVVLFAVVGAFACTGFAIILALTIFYSIRNRRRFKALDIPEQRMRFSDQTSLAEFKTEVDALMNDFNGPTRRGGRHL